jgi:hypothetical protein
MLLIPLSVATTFMHENYFGNDFFRYCNESPLFALLEKIFSASMGK